MAYAYYRLYFDDTPATADQLVRFEDITIEQEMDKACEGQFLVPIQTDDKGQWDGETEDFLMGMTRIRIEVQLLASAWVPLLDGPIINIVGGRTNEPGKSTLTLVVSDDTFFLHRDETVRSFQNSDDRIASQIFDEVFQIASTDIDPAPAASNSGFDSTVLRGTQMECLQQLARRQHMHAYVRCGDSPSESVGCFKLDPSPNQDYGLAPMILLGPDMNIFSFHSESAVGQTASFRSGRVDLNTRKIDTRTSELNDLTLQGSTPGPGPSIQRLLRPRQTDALPLDRSVQAASEKSAYALSAHGEVMKGTYPSVLQPYQFVDVLGVNGTISGTWLIRQVTHTLTRNAYGQSFRVMRNAQSSGTNSAAQQVPAGIF